MSSFATLGIEKASSGLVDSSPSKVTMMQEAIHLPEQQLPIVNFSFSTTEASIIIFPPTHDLYHPDYMHVY